MKKQRLEPLSEFSEDQAIDKIIGYMMAIYTKRNDPILQKVSVSRLRSELRRRIKVALPLIQDSRNNLLQSIAEKMTGEITASEPKGRFAWGWQDKHGRYQVRKTKDGKELMVFDDFEIGGWK